MKVIAQQSQRDLQNVTGTKSPAKSAALQKSSGLANATFLPKRDLGSKPTKSGHLQPYHRGEDCWQQNRGRGWVRDRDSPTPSKQHGASERGDGTSPAARPRVTGEPAAQVCWRFPRFLLTALYKDRCKAL